MNEGVLGTDLTRRRAIWEKGRAVLGYDPKIWRKDDFGWWMRFSDHGNLQSEYGWQEDHKVPVAVGGSDDLSNMRPLHHHNNARLGGLLGAALNR